MILSKGEIFVENFIPPGNGASWGKNLNQTVSTKPHYLLRSYQNKSIYIGHRDTPCTIYRTQHK